MSLFAWILRAVLLMCFLPLVFPLWALVSAAFASPHAFALFALAVALFALGIVLGIALGVIGNIVDLLIILGLIGLAWKWPRGIEGSFLDKLRLAYRGVKNALRRQLRHCTPTDLALCLVVLVIALVLSLSSGFLHFLLTVLIVLAVVGVVWKWPAALDLPFLAKLRISLRELKKEFRRRFR